MKLPLVRFISRILVVCMILSPLHAGAGLIGTDQVLAAGETTAARERIATILERAEVVRQLQAWGLAPDAAKARANALTDSEVVELAGKLDALPAGADSTGVVLLILAVVLVWWLFFSK